MRGALVLLGCLLVVGSCGDSSRSSAPIRIPAIRFPDAGPRVVEGEPVVEENCGDSCAPRACDGEYCRRCLLSVDGGHEVDLPATMGCQQMEPGVQVTVGLTGEVSTYKRCQSWHAIIRVRADAQVLAPLVIDSASGENHSVHWQSTASTREDGAIQLHLELERLEPLDCGGLRLLDGFLVSVVLR